MRTQLATFCVTRSTVLRDAVSQMDANKLGIVLVVDEQGRLIGTVTDGDVRRALLANLGLQQSVGAVLERKAGTRFATPVTAPIGADQSTYLNLLKAHRLLYLPLIDGDQRVAGLVTLDEFLPDEPLPIHAVVMAGGKGTRLHPLTAETPKSMLRVVDQPVLEMPLVQQKSGVSLRYWEELFLSWEEYERMGGVRSR